MAFASMTRNVMEMMVGGVAGFFAFVAFKMVSGGMKSYGPTAFTGVEWVAESSRFALAFLGVVGVLALQYFWRKTLFARWVTAGVGLLCLLTQFFPWRPAFALQQRLSPRPDIGIPVVMAFEPSMRKYQGPLEVRTDTKGKSVPREDSYTTVFLPLRIAGLPTDAVFLSDRSEVRLFPAGGGTVNVGPGHKLVIRNDAPADGEKRIYQAIQVPRSVYNRMQDQRVRLQIDDSMTLLRLAEGHAIPALGGDQRMADMGWCTTTMNDVETAIELHCLKPAKLPSCVAAFLEHPAGGERNPEWFHCAPDYAPYAPYVGRYGPDTIRRGETGLRFLDPAGLTRYPVGGRQLPESRVMLRVYEPQDHFTRRLVIPAITLKDWEAEQPEADAG